MPPAKNPGLDQPPMPPKPTLLRPSPEYLAKKRSEEGKAKKAKKAKKE